MIYLKEKKNNKILVKIGDFIVNYRYLFLIIFLILIIICAININNVSVNYDITSYLGDETETKKGIKLMEEEFGALNEIQVMLTDISYEDALNIKENISSIKNVTSVSFDSSENYFKDENALFVIELANVDAETRDEVVSEITNEVSDEKYYMYIENGEDVVEGMNIILIIGHSTAYFLTIKQPCCTAILPQKRTLSILSLSRLPKLPVGPFAAVNISPKLSFLPNYRKSVNKLLKTA